jgi:hypothetical protein
MKTLEERLTDMEILVKTPKEKFETEAKKLSLSDLHERSIELASYEKEYKDMNLHRGKIVELKRIIEDLILKKRNEERERNWKNIIEWAKDEVPKHLSTLRVLTDCGSVSRLKSGLSTPESLSNAWITPKNTKIQARLIHENKTIEVDLIRLVHPSAWQEIFNNPLQIYYFALENPNMTATTKEGKPITIWRKGANFEDDLNTKPIFQKSFIAIRSV